MANTSPACEEQDQPTILEPNSSGNPHAGPHGQRSDGWKRYTWPRTLRPTGANLGSDHRAHAARRNKGPFEGLITSHSVKTGLDSGRFCDIRFGGLPWICMHRHHEIVRSIIAEQRRLELPIRNHRHEQIGTLVPVTRSTAECDRVVEKMAAWRNRARTAFLTQFTARPDTTRSWLEDTVCTDSARLLFLIQTALGKLVGHVGFIKLTERSAELDNLVRGEIGGAPDLVAHAERALLDWMFERFEIDEVVATVFADNWRPTAIHEAQGFRRLAERRLRCVTEGDLVRYVPDDSASPQECRSVHELRLSRSDFRAGREPVA